MDKNTPSSKTDDFLTGELRYYQESFWRNEESGERRVTFLITLVTAVAAGLVALAKSSPDTQHAAGQNMGWIVIFALLSLLIVGLTTYLRMIQRNKVTDEIKRHTKYVRNLLRNRGFELEAYDPYPDLKEIRIFRGGLAELVGFLNAILISVMIFLIMMNQESGANWGDPPAQVWVFSIAGFVATGLFFSIYADWARSRHTCRLKVWEDAWPPNNNK